MTYPLGWSVVSQMVVRRERWLGGYSQRGVPLVYPGQDVQPNQPVIRLEKADRLNGNRRNSGALSAYSAQDQRQALSEAQPSPGLPGDQPSVNGLYQDKLILSGLRGRVLDVTRRGGIIIESRAAVVQGVLGVGRQVVGSLVCQRSADGLNELTPGAILVFPGVLRGDQLQQIVAAGVVGVIAGSVSLNDFESFLHISVTELLDSWDLDLFLDAERLPPLTLVLTEGLGTKPMSERPLQLLRHYNGSTALLTGLTSVNQQLFPDLVISLHEQETTQNWQPAQRDTALVRGAWVRVYGGERDGTIGEITAIFMHYVQFSSGIRARSAQLRLEDGTQIIVPLSSLERVG